MKATKQLHDLGQRFWLDNITRELGHSCYDRVETSAAPAQKDALMKLSAEQIPSTTLAEEPIQSILTRAPGNDGPIGGVKVIANSGWFSTRPPSGTEDIFKIYAERFRDGEHLRRTLAEAQIFVTTAMPGANE